MSIDLRCVKEQNNDELKCSIIKNNSEIKNPEIKTEIKTVKPNEQQQQLAVRSFFQNLPQFDLSNDSSQGLDNTTKIVIIAIVVVIFIVFAFVIGCAIYCKNKKVYPSDNPNTINTITTI